MAGPAPASWFRPLKGGRLEVCLMGDAPSGERLKVRASGSEAHIWSLVEWFESMTGKEVVGEWRRPPRTGARPMAGQLAIQLESAGDGEE